MRFGNHFKFCILQTNYKTPVTPAEETVSQLTMLRIFLFCHSGLDPESIAFLISIVSGCRIKSGMTA